MKIFFVSDIHGSIYYAKKAIEKFQEENADYIVILGDELYHGARNPLPIEYNPKEVAELLNEFSDKIIAVRGNCDSEVDEMVIKFPMMATYSMVLYEGKRLFLTHGHIYNENNLPKLRDGDVFIYGHTHIPKAEKNENIFIINPGSITFPKEDNPNSYGILEENVFKIKDLNGNIFKEINLE
ncbi:phosphodiesterase [Clostridium sp. CX1]|uniref:Phosphoesterase n=1 Tax=Clostridium tanneri TaxID=3037988 RepID=A0ABU4JY97_9CLOT|nr:MULTISPECIES: phosphodiesterase [unclassified Clostridium]MCT8978608.1 phosphodiesterase [Clostridium sp. CX1]MDW8802881.1 phosphodiesterase [Clostridium sp. A1-XYC3]